MPKCIIVPMPVGAIDKLTYKFRNYLHLPDPSPLYLLMGSAAANMIEGPPVWPMLVGPPSCGKSALLNSMLHVPHTVEAADIASEAAFLSATSRKETSKDATGGLLRQIGNHGGLILNDFTSILSKPTDKINSIMAVLRECYGGRWTRFVGTEGGRCIHWSGKLAIYGGVTGKIDQHHQISSELGERWVNYRYDSAECFAEVMLALSNDRSNWEPQLRDIVAQFFTEQGLQYGGESRPRRDFTNKEKLKIFRMASVAVRCRSSVSRDHFTKEIIGPPETEMATRLSGVLGQLLIGMDFIGVPVPAQWRILLKVSMDSMPRARKIIVEALAGGPRSIDSIQPLVGCSPKVVKRMVEDLQVHDVVTTDGKVAAFSEWMSENYRKLK